jgi:hypothetical protein
MGASLAFSLPAAVAIVAHKHYHGKNFTGQSQGMSLTGSDDVYDNECDVVLLSGLGRLNRYL